MKKDLYIFNGTITLNLQKNSSTHKKNYHSRKCVKFAAGDHQWGLNW
mgnify:CR=1 FL=1